MQTSPSDMLASTWFRYTVIALYAVGLAGVIGAYIGISLLDVQTSAYFRGTDTLEKGRGHAVRGVVLDASKGTFRTDVQVTFRLYPEPPEAIADSEPDPSSHFVLGTARPNQRGLIHTQLELPAGRDIPSGPSTLVLQATGSGLETFEARTRVRVRASESTTPTWPEPTSRLADETRRRRLSGEAVRESSGDLRVDILPFDGAFARGLTSRAYLRTYDRSTGEPVPATVRFETVEARGQWGQDDQLPQQLETDRMGIASFEWRPAGGQRWTLVARERLGEAIDRERPRRTGESTIRVYTVASQFVVQLESPVWVEDRPVRGSLHTLFRSSDVFLDLFRGDEWLAAGETSIQDRQASFALESPDLGPSQWLYRIQAYSGLYSVEEAWDVAYAVGASGRNPSDYRESLQRVVAWMAEHRDDPYFEYLDRETPFEADDSNLSELETWLRAYLEAIPRHVERSDSLFNTLEADRRELESWKDEIQRDLMIPIVLALVIALLVILYAVVTGILESRAHRETLRELDVDLEFDESLEIDGTLSEQATERRARLRRYLLIGISVATFVFFGLGLLQILSYM